MKKIYVSLDNSGRIVASTEFKEYSDGMTEFDFPDDFDFLKQDSYRIVDNELIYDPIPISDVEKEIARNEIRSKQLETALTLFVNSNTKTLTDERALSVSLLIDEWAKDTSYEKDQIVRYKDELYRIGQDHTSQEIYPPDSEGVTALYSHIKITEEGYEEWKAWDSVSGIYAKD